MMKKLIFILFLLPVLAFGQNRFPSIDSAKNYVLRYVKNSAVESFTNLRMQNVTYGTLQLLDSLCGSGVIDTIWKSGDTLKYRIGSQTVTVGVFQNGGSTDTTSLSNRINLKLNISDTANMLLPYLLSNVAAATYQPIGNYLVSGTHGSLQSLTITGTNGNGHIHLRHQASLPTATGQSTVIYANSNGDFAYKNDGNYHTTFVTSANTADRSYTFQNKSYTVADNAEVVKYTDTSAMLNGYFKTDSLTGSYIVRNKYLEVCEFVPGVSFVANSAISNSSFYIGGGVVSASATTEANRYGLISLTTTTTSNQCGYLVHATADYLLSSDTMTQEYAFKISDLSDSTGGARIYTYYIGNTVTLNSTTITNGLGILYSRASANFTGSNGSTNWQIWTASASSRTFTTSSVAVTTGWHRATIRSTTGWVQFWMDGVLLGTITSNVPTVALFPIFHIRNVSGTLSSIMADFYSADIKYITPR